MKEAKHPHVLAVKNETKNFYFQEKYRLCIKGKRHLIKLVVRLVRKPESKLRLCFIKVGHTYIHVIGMAILEILYRYHSNVIWQAIDNLCSISLDWQSFDERYITLYCEFVDVSGNLLNGSFQSHHLYGLLLISFGPVEVKANIDYSLTVSNKSNGEPVTPCGLPSFLTVSAIGSFHIIT